MDVAGVKARAGYRSPSGGLTKSVLDALFNSSLMLLISSKNQTVKEQLIILFEIAFNAKMVLFSVIDQSLLFSVRMSQWLQSAVHQ